MSRKQRLHPKAQPSTDIIRLTLSYQAQAALQVSHPFGTHFGLICSEDQCRQTDSLQAAP